MHLEKKNILLISPQPWTHIHVSKHHYAIELSKRENAIFFLNPPAGKYFIEYTGHKNIFSMGYTGFIKGFRFLPPVLKRLWFRAVVVQLERIAGVKFDLVWSFDDSILFDFNAFGKTVYKIAHLVDLNQDFNFPMFAKTADLCISNNRTVIDRFRKYNNNVHFINHGFAPPNTDLVDERPLPGVNRIKACHAGNLDIKYFDWDLFEIIVKENPDVDFVLMGPLRNTKLMSRFSGRRNVFHIGIVRSDDLQGLYAAADLLFLCYKADNFPDQLANPHKVMEYLGSGKMICATFTKEYAVMVREGLIVMSDSNATYPSLFQKCIDKLSFWNSERLRAQRIAFAIENTYEKQLKKIEERIVCDVVQNV